MKIEDIEKLRKKAKKQEKKIREKKREDKDGNLIKVDDFQDKIIL